MSDIEHSIKKLMRDRRTTYVLLFITLAFIGYLAYSKWYRSDMNGCGCMEGIHGAKHKAKEHIQYAKRVPAKEGIKSTYSVESPALKSMFENEQKKESLSSQFNMMKGRTVNKAIPTKTHEEFHAAVRNHKKEGFSSSYMPPQVMMAAKGATELNPFYGPITL